MPCESARFDIANLQLVTPGSRSCLALIVDHDLGFLMWLGDVFSELGCQAVPALNCRQGLALTKRLELSITTLVLNPELPGAARTVKALVAANPGLRVVLICDAAAHPHPNNGNGRANPTGIAATLRLERPSPGSRFPARSGCRKFEDCCPSFRGNDLPACFTADQDRSTVLVPLEGAFWSFRRLPLSEERCTMKEALL